MTVPLNFKHSKKREGEMAIKIEQMQTRRGGGSKFWAFCDNLILREYKDTRKLFWCVY